MERFNDRFLEDASLFDNTYRTSNRRTSIDIMLDDIYSENDERFSFKKFFHRYSK